MKHLCVLCMLAVLLVLSFSAAWAEKVTPPTSTMSPALAPAATGTIAYVVPDDTTGDQIWLVEPNGSNKRKIYQTGEADPYGVRGIGSLAWRPDSAELVFASNHEVACSWFASDLYALQADGSGYRRVTNAPDCAALANYRKGTVKMTLPSGGFQFYIMGLPELFWSDGGPVTINNVADLGDFRQPVVAINGKYRAMGDPVDVKADQTVDAGIVSFYPPWSSGWGAYGPAWRSDGSRIGYSFGCAALYKIADNPPVGTTGDMILSATDGVSPCGMAWGRTPSTANQIVYWVNTPDDMGIYRISEDKPTERERLVAMDISETVWVLDVEYLPDASGLIFAKVDNAGDSSNLYRYNFASRQVTKLTDYTNEYARDFSISPDGKSIIFERAPKDWMELWGGASDLWMVGTDGLNPHLFVESGAHPSWSLGAIKLSSSYKMYLPLTIKK